MGCLFSKKEILLQTVPPPDLGKYEYFTEDNSFFYSNPINSEQEYNTREVYI
jgi:hypothetical protein